MSIFTAFVCLFRLSHRCFIPRRIVYIAVTSFSTTGGLLQLPKNSSDRKAIVLTADRFEDMELYFPVFRLLETGWQVDIAAPKIERLRGENGYQVMPDLTIDDVDSAQYSLLIIPGGAPNGAPATVRKIKKAQEITRSFFSANKPVATICHGPYTLVSADVVKGRRLTSYWHDGVPQEIQKAGGEWIDSEVVVDGNLVSSRYPMDLPMFMREVMILVGSN